MGRIWDFSFADLSNTSEEGIEAASNQEINAQKEFKSLKTAIICTRSINWELLVYYKRLVFGLNPESKFAMFKDLQEAENWISS